MFAGVAKLAGVCRCADIGALILTFLPSLTYPIPSKPHYHKIDMNSQDLPPKTTRLVGPPRPSCHRQLAPELMESVAIYQMLLLSSAKKRKTLGSMVCIRLPLGLALKVDTRPLRVEADALRAIEARYTLIHALSLIHFATSSSHSCLLTPWIDGTVVTEAWDELDDYRRTRLAQEVASQMRSAADRDEPKVLKICNASRGPIKDYRIPWEDEPRHYDSWTDFSQSVWPGLDAPQRAPLTRDMAPIMERTDVPVVFSHGDLHP